jgi:hypothetical protein
VRIYVMLRKLGFAIGIVWLGIGCLHADDVLLEQFYGNGVHAYNQGDYFGAHTALTAAIKGGTNDPRAYYFRGLTYLQLGRFPEAQTDFKTGAELEVGDSSDVYPVNRSLERIQGRSRQILEQYRTVVHAAAIQRKEAERRARYEERAAAEQDVLRRVAPAELPPAAPVPSNGNQNAAVTAAPDENPFAKPAEDSTSAPSAEKNTGAQEKAAPADGKNPFDAEPSKPAPSKPAPATPQNSDDPFSESPTAVPPIQNESRAPANHNDRAVQPAAGGMSSLFRAVTKGMQGNQTGTAVAPNTAPIPDVLREILGKNQAPPAVSPEASPSPQAGGQAPPVANPPTAMAPQPETTPGAPPAGGVMQPAPPTNPAGAPPPNNPAETPKDNDNPFN